MNLERKARGARVNLMLRRQVEIEQPRPLAEAEPADRGTVKIIRGKFRKADLRQSVIAVEHDIRAAEGAARRRTFNRRILRHIAENGHRFPHTGGILKVFTVKTADHVTIGTVLRLRIALDDKQAVQPLPGGEEQLVGAVDNPSYVRRVQVAIQVVQTDDRHKIETCRAAAEQVKMPATVQIVKCIKVFFTVERMALGLKKDPQPAIGFLNSNAAPVNRHIHDIAGIDIMVHQIDRLGIVRTETFQKSTVVPQQNVFHTEYRHRVRAEALLDYCQHVIKTGSGETRFGEQQDMELFQVPFPGRHEIQHRIDQAPLFFRINQAEANFRPLEMVGNLGHHAVEVVPQGKFKIHFFVDDFRHRPCP